MANKAEAAIALQGYIHNQAPQFNVRDLLLAGQQVDTAAKEGVGIMQAEGDRRARAHANVYVSELLGKATPENYREQFIKAGAMAPYASEALMNQVKDTRGQMQYDQGVATHAKERLYDETRWTAQDKETVRMNEELIRHQGVVEKQSQQQIDNTVAQMKQQYSLGMAGIAMQGKQLSAQIDNNRFLRAGVIADQAGKGYEYKNGAYTFNPDVGATVDAQGNKQMSPYRYGISLATNKSVAEARTLLDPTKMLDARAKKNTFGGLFELDDTTLSPLDRVSSALGTVIHPRDAEAWRQKILSNPKAASKALDSLGVPK